MEERTDLISRQEAIDAVADLYWMDERLLNFKKEIDATFDKIKALPSAQPEPRRGKWVPREYPMPLSDSTKIGYECSECHTHWDTETRFCPYCGAKMDEV